MTPLSRPALLAVLLLTPAVLLAQSDSDGEAQARARLAALKAQYSGAGAQRPADAAPAAAAAPASAVDPAKLASSKAVIASARLSPEKLGWTEQNIADLGPAITAASRAVEKLHEDNPSNVSATFYGNGTMVNLEESIKAATGAWGGSDFKRGCVSHQNVTLNAVAKVLSRTSLEFHGIQVMRGVGPHHAVIVFPMGTDWKKTGVIFDGWIHQESAPDRMMYTFKDWYGFQSWHVELE